MKLHILVAGAALSLLAGCLPDSAPDTIPDSTPEAEPLSCAAQGGTEVFYGMSGAPGCAIPATDAGRACTTGAECSGFCDAGTLTCSPSVEPVYCNRYVDDAGVVIDGGATPPCSMN